jgi:hypothetical protein
MTITQDSGDQVTRERLGLTLTVSLPPAGRRSA